MSVILTGRPSVEPVPPALRVDPVHDVGALDDGRPDLLAVDRLVRRAAVAGQPIFVERFMSLCEDMAGGMGGTQAVG